MHHHRRLDNCAELARRSRAIPLRNIPASDDIVDRIYQRAKQSDHTLSEAEILECVPVPALKK